MTFFEAFHRFWQADQQAAFSGTETKMYFAIVKVANDLHWKHEQLHIPNMKLMGMMNCTIKTLERARHVLANHNLIDYVPGKNGREAPTYTLLSEDSTPLKSTAVESTAVKMSKKFPNNVPHIKDKDKDKNKYGGKEKLHDGSTEVFDFFRNNFEDSERIIARLKSEKALGKNFVGFILYLIERGLKNAIIKADSPVKFIMFFAQREREWVAFQMWDSERHKREGDVIDRSRAEDFSHNSV